MATQAIHQRNLIIFDSDKDKLLEILNDKAKFSLVTKTGFTELQDQYINGYQYKLIFPKTIKAKEIDIDTWDYHSREWKINFHTDVEFSFDEKVALVFGPRNGYTPILSTIKDEDESVQFEFIDFDLDLPEMIKELHHLNPSMTFKSLKIRDYLDDTGMKTTANFKVNGSCDIPRFVTENEDNIVAFRAEIKTDSETKFTITLDRKGTYKLGGDWPEGIYSQILRLSKQFDQSAAKQGSQAQLAAVQAASTPPPAPPQLQIS